MTFWLIYAAGAASIPLSVVLSESLLVLEDRWKGGHGLIARGTTKIVGSMILSWCVLTLGVYLVSNLLPYK